MQRYFSDKIKKEQIMLEEKDLHHIYNVMRLKANDNIEIVCNKEVYLCKVNEEKNNMFSIIEKINQNKELAKHITIAFSLVKEEKVSLILQKCTELGISEFIPLNLERCVVKLDKKEDKKLERWKSIVKEASEQSKRNVIPKINRILKIDELIKLNYDLKIICSLHTDAIKIKKVLQNHINCDTILIVVGPEGGITLKEEDTLVENGFIRTSLLKTVLRTETAPIYISSVLNYEYME